MIVRLLPRVFVCCLLQLLKLNVVDGGSGQKSFEKNLLDRIGLVFVVVKKNF